MKLVKDLELNQLMESNIIKFDVTISISLPFFGSKASIDNFFYLWISFLAKNLVVLLI